MQSLNMRLLVVLSVLALLFSGVACTGGWTSGGGGTGDVDTIGLDTVRLADTSSFIKASGERVGIYAEAMICVPAVAPSDTGTLLRLQRWFATRVLAAPDSLTLQQALQLNVSNSLHQYDLLDISPEEMGLIPDECTECEVVYKYNTLTQVTLQRNDHGLATFCRLDVVKKNDRVTSVTHHYYTYDFVTGEDVDLSHLLRDDALADVTQLVRQRLLDQNNVSNADQLGELGYFNADNLWLTGNFYFGADGLTWSYPPGELAVDAIGEPTVTIAYDDIRPYATDASPLRRF